MSDTLKGNVKSCIYFYYDTFKPGDDIDSNWVGKLVITHDLSGKKSAVYMYNGAPNYKCTFSVINIYDKYGREVLSKEQSGSVISRSRYIKSDENLIIINFSGSRRPLSKIIKNKKGFIDTTYSYANDGVLTSKTLYKYGANDQLKELLNYKSTGELNYSEIYEYDIRNNKISEIRYSAKGIRASRENYTYDGNDNIIIEADSNTFAIGGFAPYDNLKEGQIHTRHYRFSRLDNYQNWLQEDALLNNEPVKTIKRKIEYYN